MGEELFVPTRDAALSKLRDFLPAAGKSYESKRNFDLGPSDRSNISLLSPYLRHRVLTEEEVISQVLSKHSKQEAEKFIQEVLWRTYWKGWLEMRPGIWDYYKKEVRRRREQLSVSSELQEGYQRAISGKSGIECFDAWTAELLTYGYLHNHARMWYASIWIFTLNLPWALGADFFYQHLFDGDPASNTLSWRWVAGLQTIGKHYVASASNIQKFTNGRYVPSEPLSIEPKPISRTEEDDTVCRKQEELKPCVEKFGNEPFILLLHEDDLSPDSELLESENLRGVFLLDHRLQSSTKSDVASQFLNKLLSDRRAHLSGRLDIASEGTSIADYAEERGATAIAFYQPFVGPVRDGFPLLPERFTLYRLRKSWDSKLFPLAAKGFFRFRSMVKEYGLL